MGNRVRAHLQHSLQKQNIFWLLAGTILLLAQTEWWPHKVFYTTKNKQRYLDTDLGVFMHGDKSQGKGPFSWVFCESSMHVVSTCQQKNMHFCDSGLSLLLDFPSLFLCGCHYCVEVCTFWTKYLPHCVPPLIIPACYDGLSSACHLFALLFSSVLYFKWAKTPSKTNLQATDVFFRIALKTHLYHNAYWKLWSDNGQEEGWYILSKDLIYLIV